MAWWWKIRGPSAEETLRSALSEALDKLYARQSEQIEAQTKFLGDLVSMNVRAGARALGTRGGLASQRKRRERAAQAASGCALCRDPFTRPTLEMIAQHRAHGSGGLAMPDGGGGLAQAPAAVSNNGGQS